MVAPKWLSHVALLTIPGIGWAQQTKPQDTLVERVGSTGFIQVQAESFRALDARQQALAYWLSQASIAIDPIIYDQVSRFGLRQKHLLDAIAAHPEGIAPATLQKIMAFTKLFWANRGNHNEMTSQKNLPPFSYDELVDAALAGFDRRETVTIPPLPDADQWADFEAARKVMIPNFSQVHAAGRYRNAA